MNPPATNLKTVSQDAGSAALDVLLSRRSNSSLTTPVPTDADLNVIFDVAMRAADHDRMRPWSFHVLRGPAAIEQLWNLYEAAMLRREPNMDKAMIAGAKMKLMKAPMIIAVGCHIQPGKIMEIEQLFSSAAGAQNIMNAIHALGYAGKWVTGANMYDEEVNKAFGYTAPDRLIGLIYVGTASDPAPEVKKTWSRESFVKEWTGPVA